MDQRRSIAEMFGSGAVETFLGLPACPDLQALDAGIAILGVPCATPYPAVGAYCAAAPRALRDAIAPYAGSRAHFDFDLGGPLFPDGRVDAVDCGDLPYDEADAEGNRVRIRDSVGRILDKGAVPLVIGGDDSIPIPLFQAFAGRGDFTLLQIDAHIDWRDEVGGERWGLSSTMRRASEMPQISRIVQVGQRGLGSARPGDRADALAWGVHFHSAQAVHREGIGAALDFIPAGAEVIVSIDCDGLDPSVIPGVIGRAPGGLGYWQTVELLQGVAEKARIAAFAIVEFMPERDIDDIGALAAARLLCNAMGLVARGRPQTSHEMRRDP